MEKRHSRPRDRARASRWAAADAGAMLAAAEASGMTLRAFAHREGLDAQRLYRWRRRITEEAAAERPMFVEVARETVTPTQAIEVLLRTDRVLRVPGSFDETVLLRLVELLE